MPEHANVLLLAADALIYFTTLAYLLCLRDRIGLGPFFCALGVLHFLETYLAGIFYITLPFGIVASPGSTILFTGKLMLLLLLYIREGAAAVRQPIYGLLFGNVLVIALGFLLRLHTLAAVATGRTADFSFLNEIGGLMVWGTAVLFVDCLIIILLYERSRGWFGDTVFPRVLLAGAVVMSFDQIAFFLGLRVVTGAGMAVLVGGWIAKMAAVTFYSVLGTIYLLYIERAERWRGMQQLRQVLDALTYRDGLGGKPTRTAAEAMTLIPDREALASGAGRAIDLALANGRSMSLMLFDPDGLAGVNQRAGRDAGDRILSLAAQAIRGAVRPSDMPYRFDGEEFVVIASGLTAGDAAAMADTIRRNFASAVSNDPAGPVTLSGGLATGPGDGRSFDSLLLMTAGRLAEAKARGGNRVVSSSD